MSAPKLSHGEFSIGGGVWPGLSKLIEEAGEVLQVAGKLIATSGGAAHWDGSDLRLRLQEELADLSAAIAFVVEACDLDDDAIIGRLDDKGALFRRWHREQAAVIEAAVKLRVARGFPDEGEAFRGLKLALDALPAPTEEETSR